MKGVKMNLETVNCVLLVVILALVIYCVVKQNENFDVRNATYDEANRMIQNNPLNMGNRNHQNASVLDKPETRLTRFQRGAGVGDLALQRGYHVGAVGGEGSVKDRLLRGGGR
jgi:hypothetical protein